MLDVNLKPKVVASRMCLAISYFGFARLVWCITKKGKIHYRYVKIKTYSKHNNPMRIRLDTTQGI